jgi:hypothetical protein
VPLVSFFLFHLWGGFSFGYMVFLLWGGFSFGGMLYKVDLDLNAGVSILCEDGTITMYGKGNRIFAETASVQGGKQELVFVPVSKISRVSRAARAR